MRNDFALIENDGVQDDEDESDRCETSDNEIEVDAIGLTAEDGVITVRCAVHTLQLSVHDFFEANFSVKEMVSKFRNVAKKSHKQSIRELFKHNNKPNPRLDGETRWGSIFVMFESMLHVRDLLDQIALANESLLLSNEDWVAAHDLTECLKPVYEATMAFHFRKLTAGEFFGQWLKCKIQLQRSGATSSLSMAMLHAMESRETSLLSNAAFVAAVYVDPRYQVLLKHPQRKIAQAHLISLWRRFQLLQQSANTSSTGHVSSSESENGLTCDDDIIEEILATSDACSASESSREEKEVEDMIKLFDNHNRLQKNTNIFDWWNKQPDSNFKSIANIALAQPVTQASVERTFSDLRYHTA